MGTCIDGTCSYGLKNDPEGMTGGAVLALIIFIVVLVVAIAAGIFVLCKKKPEDAMIAHNAIYNSLESEEQL